MNKKLKLYVLAALLVILSFVCLLQFSPDCLVSFQDQHPTWVDSEKILFLRDGNTDRMMIYSLPVSRSSEVYEFSSGFEQLDYCGKMFGDNCIKLRNKDEFYVHRTAFYNVKNKYMGLVSVPGVKNEIIDFNNNYYVFDDTVFKKDQLKINVMIYGCNIRKINSVELNRIIKCSIGENYHTKYRIIPLFSVDSARVYIGLIDFSDMHFYLYDYNYTTGKNSLIYECSEIAIPLYSEKSDRIVILKRDTFEVLDVNSGKKVKYKFLHSEFFINGFLRENKLLLYRVDINRNRTVNKKLKHYIESIDLNNNAATQVYDMPVFVSEVCNYMDADPEGSKIVFTNEIDGCLYIYDLDNKTISKITSQGLFSGIKQIGRVLEYFKNIELFFKH